jgi:hypothetical protein
VDSHTDFRWQSPLPGIGLNCRDAYPMVAKLGFPPESLQAPKRAGGSFSPRCRFPWEFQIKAT